METSLHKLQGRMKQKRMFKKEIQVSGSPYSSSFPLASSSCSQGLWDIVLLLTPTEGEPVQAE